MFRLAGVLTAVHDIFLWAIAWVTASGTQLLRDKLVDDNSPHKQWP